MTLKPGHLGSNIGSVIYQVCDLGTLMQPLRAYATSQFPPLENGDNSACLAGWLARLDELMYVRYLKQGREQSQPMGWVLACRAH